MPAKATEAWLERASFLAIARTQQDGARLIATQHARATSAQASSNASYTINSAMIDVGQISSLAQIDAQADLTLGSGQASVSLMEATIQGSAALAEAANQVAAANRERTADLATIEAATNAQVQVSARLAEIAGESRVSLANSEAVSARLEATIRAATVTRIAQARDRGSLFEANLRAQGMAVTATIRADAAGVIAVHQVAATLGVARAQADADVAVANIRAGEEGAIVSIQAASASVVTAHRARDARESAASQVREIRGSRVERDREEAAVSTAGAANQVTIARLSSEGRGRVAEIRSLATRTTADLEYQAVAGSADSRATEVLVRAEASDQGGRYTADLGLVSTRYDAARDREGALSVATARSGAEAYQADARHSVVVEREQGENRRLLRTLAFADARFDEAWGVIGSLAPPGTPATAPAYVRARPAVRRATVWSPSRIQTKINRIRSEGAVKAEGRWLDYARESAGRGAGGSGAAGAGQRLSAGLARARESGRESSEALVAARAENAKAALESAAVNGAAIAAFNQALLDAEANLVRRRVGILADIAGAVRAAVR